MSKYEEICEEFKTADLEWRERERRCRDYMQGLADGFLAHRGVPGDRINLMRWSGQSEAGDEYRLAPPETLRYGIQQAMRFDESDGYWYLGLRINIGRARLGWLFTMRRDLLEVNWEGRVVMIFRLDFQERAKLIK
jgi:hypothetical protein